jgi:hypothetical protein
MVHNFLSRHPELVEGSDSLSFFSRGELLSTKTISNGRAFGVAHTSLILRQAQDDGS